MSLIAVADIEEELGKTFTEGQKAAITRKVDALRDELENFLHATLERRERTDTVELTGTGRLHLLGPIIKIQQVIKIGATSDSSFVRSVDPVWPDVIVPQDGRPGDVYEVTYEAGYLNVAAAVYELIWNGIIREKIVGTAVASGAYSSLNVEGASVGFGGAYSGNQPDRKGSFSRAELDTVRHLRRMVVA